MRFSAKALQKIGVFALIPLITEHSEQNLFFTLGNS
ncbi:hypothetical protein BN8_01169 [Fibrisoma limi BUZ 3]|uniref:Uncharacterized protein n=1 Tax=Fibrisoma limi BUZ 3 TaxID=1185876 RepID=I2GE67_9BACT|nr:hypothetical protein BN8_01169 [Fibrisoma limi BUZ 3]